MWAACVARLLGLLGLGSVGSDFGFRALGASPVSRGRRHLCARCGSTRELGVPCCISIWALGFASHRSHVHCLWSFVFPVRSCSVGPPVCPVVLGFRSVGSRVRCQVSSWAGAVSCTSCRVRGPSLNEVHLLIWCTATPYGVCPGRACTRADAGGGGREKIV